MMVGERLAVWLAPAAIRQRGQDGRVRTRLVGVGAVVLAAALALGGRTAPRLRGRARRDPDRCC